MLNAGKLATGMKPHIYILFLFSVLPHTPTARQRRPRGTSPVPALPFGRFLRWAGRETLPGDTMSGKGASVFSGEVTVHWCYPVTLRDDTTQNRQHTTIPRAFKMLSLHIGQVQCSLSQGSTQDLWKTCLKKWRIVSEIICERLLGQSIKEL